MPIYRSCNFDFFKKWSDDMAYILGFLFADGNIMKTKRHSYFTAIYTADKKLLYAIQKVMKAEQKISRIISDTGNVYRIQIGSKEMFNDLTKLGCIPNKTRRMLLPLIPKKHIGNFIRGYFDGDGSVWMGYIHKNRKKKTLVLQTVFTSGSLEFLKELLHTLQDMGLEGGSLFKVKNGNYGRLIFSVKDSLKLYKIMYNGSHTLFLNRKKCVFERYAKMRV